ncbi:hypothetical protein [Pedobacter jejuensis]|nr:hypothetical protein [Pedobacter jejuensis]
MKYELTKLEACLNKWSSEKSLTNVEEQLAAFRQHTWDAEKAIIHSLLLQRNQTSLHTYFSIHMQKLVELCDKLYELFDKNVSHQTIMLTLNLLGALKKAAPTLIDRDLALPKAFRVIQGDIFKNQWQVLLLRFDELSLSPELAQIIELPLDEFSSLKRKLSWFHYIWLKQYFAELEQIDFSKYDQYPGPEHLLHVCLIKLNFNHPRLMTYCCELIKEKANGSEELKEQLFVLSMTKKILKQTTMLTDEPFYQKQQSIVEDICKWIDEELDFRNLYDVAVFTHNGRKVPVNPYKYIYDMTLEQLAFWKKLQYDHKVYIEDNIDNFSIKIAYNSSTKNKEELSVGSITSKLYSKDQKVIAPVHEIVAAMNATLRPILELLERMLEDLRPFMA